MILSSKDKDLRQCLVRDRVNQMISWKRSRENWLFEWFTEAKLMERFGVTPQQWIEVQLLHGDPVIMCQGSRVSVKPRRSS